MRGRAESAAGQRPEPVGSVFKAFEVLRAFIDGQDQWGVRELAPVLGLPRSTVHRMLVRLRLDGFLEYDEAVKKYRLGFQFFRLAAAAYRRNDQMQAVAPVLRELSHASAEDAWFAMYDAASNRVAYVGAEASSQIVRPTAPIGREEDLTASAFGMAVLAQLDLPSRKATITAARTAAARELEATLRKISERGFAVMSQREADAVAIAACVRGPNEAVMGSIGLVVPRQRYEPHREQILGDLVVATARRLGYRLGTRFLGGASSGSWHEAVSIISEMLSRHDHGVVVAPASGGGLRNLEDLARGLGSYALTTAASLYDAVHGRGRFERKLSNLRAVMKLSELHMHVITRPGVRLTEVSDLVGLRLCPGEERYSSAHALDDVLKVARISRARLERSGAILYMDLPEAIRQFKAGFIDVMIWLAAQGAPGVREIEFEAGTALSGLPQRMLERLIVINPGYQIGLLDPRHYPKWLGEPIPTLVDPTVLVCTTRSTEEEVYKVAKTVFEGREQLAVRAAAHESLDESFALSGLSAPLHPGAARYFAQLRNRAVAKSK